MALRRRPERSHGVFRRGADTLDRSPGHWERKVSKGNALLNSKTLVRVILNISFLPFIAP